MGSSLRKARWELGNRKVCRGACYYPAIRPSSEWTQIDRPQSTWSYPLPLCLTDDRRLPNQPGKCNTYTLGTINDAHEGMDRMGINDRLLAHWKFRRRLPGFVRQRQPRREPRRGSRGCWAATAVSFGAAPALTGVPRRLKCRPANRWHSAAATSRWRLGCNCRPTAPTYTATSSANSIPQPAPA